TSRGYTNELEKDYGLVYNFEEQEAGMNQILYLLKKKNLRQEWQRKRRKMLSEKIDLTAWMIDYIKYTKVYKLLHTM
ncbi:unnamed protein product, partial [marine sediment metagenome]